MSSAVLAIIPTGPYINGYALAAMIVVLLLWARLMTWVDKDGPAARLPRQIINAGMWGGLIVALFVFFTIPLGFWPDFAIYIGILLIDFGVYLALRYQKIGLGDLVTDIKGMFQSKGEKKQKEAKAAAGQIVIVNKAGVPMTAPDPQMPERHQYDAAQLILGDPIKRGAERIDVTVSNDGAAVNYLVDGFQYEGAGLDRGAASDAIGYFKFIAALDPAEKRKPQTGPFKTILNNVKREMQVTTKGSSSTESMTIIAEPKKRHAFTIGTLGFSAEQLEIVKQAIADGSGMVILTAPQGQGLTALEYAMMRGHDAFLQHILTIERTPEQDIEGVTQNTLAPTATPQEEAKQVAWVISQEPDVVLMASIDDSNSARDLADYADHPKKRAYIGMRAAGAFEALKQWRKLVGDDNLAIKSLKMIIAGRTLRKLCEACKVGYTPDPTLLKKLNMNPAKVTTLYQARTTPMVDAKGRPVPCTFCNDLAFKGRTGVYELLVIDETMRQILLNNGSENELKKAYREQKGRYLQEVALELVEQGETSVNEVQRALRHESASGGGKQEAPAADAAPKRTRPSGAAKKQ